MNEERRSLWRVRWAAVGAAVAVTVGAGGLAFSHAASSGASTFVPITPCRLIDTRTTSTVGPRSNPLGASETVTFTVWGTNGNCTIPAGATAVAANITTVDGSAPSFLTIWPSDASRPTASTNNWIASQPPTPNKVDVKLSADGKVSVFNSAGTVNVVADLVGYYEAPATSPGVEYVEVNTVNVVNASDTVLASITVSAPSAGFVLVDATTSVQAGSFQAFSCGISLSTAMEAQGVVTQITGSAASSVAVAASRGYAVNAGDTTFNFICKKNDAAATVSAGGRTLSAVFSPNRV